MVNKINKLPENYNEGAILLVNKPLDWTSFDVVKKVRNQVKAKTGHAGTLDPKATGLLILCTGKFTKKLSEFQGMDKEYTGTLRLGATTPSYDIETEADQLFELDDISEDKIRKAADNLIGEIKQIPPPYSAVKVKGQRSYKLARKGEAIKAKERTVNIFEFSITHIDLPDASFKVKCSKGTYIRSLVYDLGKNLDNGAYLTSLCRTAIGPYLLEDAWDLDELVEVINQNKK